MSTAIDGNSARILSRRLDRAAAAAAAPAPEATPAAAVQKPQLVATASTDAGPAEIPSLEARAAARDGVHANEARLRQRLLDPASPSAEATKSAGVRNGRRAFALAAPALDTARLQSATADAPTTFAEVQDGLRNGRTDDAFRDGMHDVFSAASVDESHQMMEEIRNEGLLDAFLDASLRNADGDPSDPVIRDAMREVFETGRLDLYAETVTGHPFSLYAPTADQTSHYYSRANGGIFINQDNAAAMTSERLGGILAHETYHAFNHDHGGTRGALNEGMGIAAAAYAFGDDDYSLSEQVYGTKNYYRDVRDDSNYPFGTLEGADAKLLDFTNQLASRDSSGLAWDDPSQLEDEYLFWEPFARISDVDGNGDNDWEEPGGYAEQAQADVDAYRAGTIPLPEKPSTWDRFWGWLGGLFD